jgi:hypothetical protein
MQRGVGEAQEPGDEAKGEKVLEAGEVGRGIGAQSFAPATFGARGSAARRRSSRAGSAPARSSTAPSGSSAPISCCTLPSRMKVTSSMEAFP